MRWQAHPKSNHLSFVQSQEGVFTGKEQEEKVCCRSIGSRTKNSLTDCSTETQFIIPTNLQLEPNEEHCGTLGFLCGEESEPGTGVQSKSLMLITTFYCLFDFWAILGSTPGLRAILPPPHLPLPTTHQPQRQDQSRERGHRAE